MTESPLLTYQQAAEYLSTTESHLQHLWRKREVKAVKVGNKVRFHREDLDSYIDGQRS